MSIYFKIKKMLIYHLKSLCITSNPGIIGRCDPKIHASLWTPRGRAKEEMDGKSVAFACC